MKSNFPVTLPSLLPSASSYLIGHIGNIIGVFLTGPPHFQYQNEKLDRYNQFISEKLPSCNSTLPFSRSSYRTDGLIIVKLQIELITSHCLLSAINHWLYILFDLISSSIAARFQVKTLNEPRTSCTTVQIYNQAKEDKKEHCNR